MKTDGIIEIIKKERWWQADGPGYFQTIQLPCLGFTKLTKYYPDLKHDFLMMVSDNSYFYQFMTESDSINFIDYIAQKDKQDKLYLKKRIAQWHKINNDLNLFLGELELANFSKIGNKEIYRLFEIFYQKSTDAWALPVIIEGDYIYLEKEMSRKLGSKSIALLTMPERPSFIKREEEDILKIALLLKQKNVSSKISIGAFKKKYPAIYQKLLRHQKSFFWIRDNYKYQLVISAQQFLKEAFLAGKGKTKKQIIIEIRQASNFKDLKRKKEALRKKLKIESDLLRLLYLFSIFGWWKDERKEMCLKTTHYIKVFIKELAKRMDLSFDLAGYLFNEEIKDFLLRGKGVSQNKLKQRKQAVIFFSFQNEKYKIVSGREAKTYFKAIMDRMKETNKERGGLRGLVASTGGKKKIRGTVSVVLDYKKDRFEAGSILITSMTRPEFVPLIKKSIAVITNEGGITSHAAIVSRELNIPCIIGTRTATQALKTGDIIEVDLEKGEIKIKHE